MRNFFGKIKYYFNEIHSFKTFILSSTIISCILGYYIFDKSSVYVSTIKFEYNQNLKSRQVGDFYPHSGELWEIYDEESLKVVNAYFRKNAAEKFIKVIEGSDFLSKLYMSEIKVGDSKDIVANFILRSIYGEKTSVIKSDKIEFCSDSELIILNSLHEKVISNAYILATDAHEGEIFEVRVKSNNHDVSQAIIQTFYKVLNKHFKELSNKKQERFRDVLNQRKKELQLEYRNVYSDYLNYRQRFFKINSLSGDWLNILQLKMEEEHLDEQLNEITKITGEIKLNIEDTGPQFLLLNDSYMPTIEKNNYLLKNFLLGLSGFLISIFIIISKKIIQDALQS